MVWEADPDQLEVVGHPLGVPVEVLGRDALRGTEDPAQGPGQSMCPICTHGTMIGTNWLAIQ
jgi:hypothetical protein